MFRTHAWPIAGVAVAVMALGAGMSNAGSMKAPSTGSVSGDWDIDTEALGTQSHLGESVGAELFHVDFSARTDARGHSRLEGYVYDDEGQPATNVALRIATLDSQGREVEVVTRPVQGTIPGEGRVYFDVPVPDGVAYRVTVASFDLVEFGPG